jgi:plastocyanin
MSALVVSRREVGTRILTAVTGIGAMLAVSACGGTASGAGGAAAGAGETITIRATDFKFEPGQIKMAGPGDLSIKMENKGALEHDLVIEGVPGVLLVKAGATGSRTFKIPKSGTYNVVCSLPGHKDAGMKGTLTVD